MRVSSPLEPSPPHPWAGPPIEDFGKLIAKLTLEILGDLTIVLADVEPAPAAVAGPIVVRVGGLVRLRGHVGGAQDALAEVVDAVQVVAVVVVRQVGRLVRGQPGVDARHHEQAVQLVRHGRGGKGCLVGAPAGAAREHCLPLLQDPVAHEFCRVPRHEAGVRVEFHHRRIHCKRC